MVKYPKVYSQELTTTRGAEFDNLDFTLEMVVVEVVEFDNPDFTLEMVVESAGLVQSAQCHSKGKAQA